MNKPRSHFCIDIDNVVARTDVEMRRLILSISGGKVDLKYHDIKTFNYFECQDCNGNSITKEDWKKVHDRFSEHDIIMRLEPFVGVVDGLRQLAEKGTVHLATSRLRKARKATVEWLDKHQFPTHDLHFLSYGEKHAALKRFTAAVEDDYKQAVAFATLGETPCFLMTHPWNEDGKAVNHVEWVNDWAQLTPRLLALA